MRSTMTYGTIGTLSHGTLLSSDLLPAFADELETLAKQARQFNRYRKLIGEARKLARKSEDAWTDEEREHADFLINEQLTNALNDFAPPYCYFGAHPGDGSDFGFWFDSDGFDTAVRDKEIVKLDELPSEIAVVNDHGNVTIYAITARELISIV